jgi:hypothetical protein
VKCRRLEPPRAALNPNHESDKRDESRERDRSGDDRVPLAMALPSRVVEDGSGASSHVRVTIISHAASLKYRHLRLLPWRKQGDQRFSAATTGLGRVVPKRGFCRTLFWRGELAASRPSLSWRLEGRSEESNRSIRQLCKVRRLQLFWLNQEKIANIARERASRKVRHS